VSLTVIVLPVIKVSKESVANLDDKCIYFGGVNSNCNRNIVVVYARLPLDVDETDPSMFMTTKEPIDVVVNIASHRKGNFSFTDSNDYVFFTVNPRANTCSLSPRVKVFSWAQSGKVANISVDTGVLKRKAEDDECINYHFHKKHEVDFGQYQRLMDRIGGHRSDANFLNALEVFIGQYDPHPSRVVDHSPSPADLIISNNNNNNKNSEKDNNVFLPHSESLMMHMFDNHSNNNNNIIDGCNNNNNNNTNTNKNMSSLFDDVSLYVTGSDDEFEFPHYQIQRRQPRHRSDVFEDVNDLIFT